jgi:hypothetical protein
LIQLYKQLGRKRSKNPNTDRCSFYIRNYPSKSIQLFLRSNEKQLIPIKKYLTNKEEFIDWLKENNLTKEFSKKNCLLYTNWDNSDKEELNQVKYIKYLLDNKNMKQMLEKGFINVIKQALGNDLTYATKDELSLQNKKKDMFLEYLDSITNKKLFKEEQSILKVKFEEIGLKDRTMGIHTLNGKLKDCNYLFKIISGREKNRNSKNRDKTYWLVTKYEI